IDLVYKAWDTEARSIVALKLLREEFLDRPEVCAHYLTQAERHSRMVHPHVLEPRDFGEADGRVYVALDFVEGRSLEEWLAAEEAVAAQVAAQDAAAAIAENADAGGAPPRAAPAETVESQMSMRLGTPQALRILRDVAAALGYAHERGLAHRGVRPSNILIDGHFEGFLGDFGMDPEGQVDLAAPATAPSPAAAGEGRGEGMSAPPSAPATSAAATSPPPPSPRVRPTWAPEQAAGRWSEVGARADVFALGVILYRILAGRPPFFGADDTELARAIRHDEPPPFRSASRYVQSDLKAVCLTCLEKEPALRYANGREVADELTRFFEGKRTIARPITRFQRWSRRVRRHAVVATLVVATVLSVLLLGGLRAYAARARADRVQQLLRAGRLREVGGNLRGALAAYKDASATDPANPAAEAEVKRATALLDKRAAERKLVEGTAEELAGVYRAEFWAEVGRARLDLMRAAKTAGRPYGEDAQRAETALDRAISLDDRCADALAARGLLNETLELYDQALNDYESADSLLQGSSPDVRAAVERMRALFGHGFQK
ncbi:MAG: serine/threonine protein kinase, partial [Planctomycetes bacterium]|nr:serine/threonine protein kinase [Planctomycetota bacterium]